MPKCIKIAFCLLTACLSAFCGRAEIVLCDLQAEFVANKNEQKLVANKVALEDHVQLVSNGTWEGSHDSWLVQKGDLLTVTAEEFGNIYLVTVVAYWEYDSEHSTATVVNAIGPAIKNLDDLGVMEPVKPVKSTKKIDENEEDMLTYNFRFKDGVRLSDVTLEFGADVCIYSVKAYLDVTAELPDGETNLVGDDKLLIAKRSNAVDYIYTVTNDTDEIHSSPSDFDDYEELFKPLPEEGVSLVGHPEGKYVLYVAAVPNSNNVNVPSNTNHVFVNYSTKSQSTNIDEVAVSKAEYFDLQGRRVMKPAKGLCIVRNGTASRVQLIK